MIHRKTARWVLARAEVTGVVFGTEALVVGVDGGGMARAVRLGV